MAAVIVCEISSCKHRDFRLSTQFIAQWDFLHKIIETSHTIMAATQYVIGTLWKITFLCLWGVSSWLWSHPILAVPQRRPVQYQKIKFSVPLSAFLHFCRILFRTGKRSDEWKFRGGKRDAGWKLRYEPEQSAPFCQQGKAVEDCQHGSQSEQVDSTNRND